MNHVLTRLVLPIAILCIGIALAALLVVVGPRTAPSVAPRVAIPVEVVVAQPETASVRVAGTGVVEPDQSVNLVPEVAGRVTWVSDRLRPGGRFGRGEALAKIDARDYEAATIAEQARLRQAEVELRLEQERQVTAKRQWALLGDDRDAEAASLALRQPQLQLAQANVDSAKAALERAQRNVDRTYLTAPFDAVVLSEGVDVGQTVGAGAGAVASLAGTERFRVPVSVPVEALGALDVPGINAEAGSSAVVRQRLGGTEREWPGTVAGLQGQLDPATRTALLLVTIDRPLDAIEQGQLPLLPGAFVDVGITGRPRADVYAVPREALHDRDHVWVVVEDALHRVDVTVAFEDERTAYLASGLAPGMQVVTSRMSNPIEGQAVIAAGRVPAVGAFERQE